MLCYKTGKLYDHDMLRLLNIIRLSSIYVNFRLPRFGLSSMKKCNFLLGGKNNTLFDLYRCFTTVLRNIFAKRIANIFTCSVCIFPFFRIITPVEQKRHKKQSNDQWRLLNDLINVTSNECIAGNG